MQIVALDGTKLIVLMLAGAAFALAGLWLMFRPQLEGEAARIELFGLKVQASSAGLLVFLIGAAFLAVPIFVPERPQSSVAAGRGPHDSNATSERSEAGQSGGPAIILPVGADAAEQEPNNLMGEANQITRGVFYAGRLERARSDTRDWYVLPTADRQGQDIEIQVRSLAQNTGCELTVFDDREQHLRTWKLPREGSSNYQTLFVGDSEHVFIRAYLPSYVSFCQYEIKVD